MLLRVSPAALDHVAGGHQFTDAGIEYLCMTLASGTHRFGQAYSKEAVKVVAGRGKICGKDCFPGDVMIISAGEEKTFVVENGRSLVCLCSVGWRGLVEMTAGCKLQLRVQDIPHPVTLYNDGFVYHDERGNHFRNSLTLLDAKGVGLGRYYESQILSIAVCCDE